MGTITDHCRLCGSGGPLQDSHVLSEFIWKPIYDERHKGYAIDPLDPRRSRKFQKGLTEPMLCRGCEQFLNDEYEKPFKELWFDRGPLTPLETANEAILSIPDYGRFKLFHLSILLRAELARRGTWSEVSVGDKHRKRLIEMVRSKEAGAAHEYPIVCVAIRGPSGGVWWDLIHPPIPGRLYGTKYYHFTFGGCDWRYFVCSHREPRIERIALRDDGMMPVIKQEWAMVRRYAPYARRSVYGRDREARLARRSARASSGRSAGHSPKADEDSSDRGRAPAESV